MGHQKDGCLFEVYLHQPYRFHLRRNSAPLIRNAVTQVPILIANVLRPGLLLLAESLVLVGLLGLLLVIEPIDAVTIGAIFAQSA